MLWKQKRQNHQRAAQQQRGDQWLWQRVSGGDGNSSAEGGTSGPGRELGDDAAGARELAALAEISDAVVAAGIEEEGRIDQDSLAAFEPIHRRLMDAIELSQRGSVQPWQSAAVAAGKSAAAAGSFLQRRPRNNIGWQRLLGGRAASWVVAVPLLLLITVGSHALGRAGARHASMDLPMKALVDDFDARLHSASPFDFVAYSPADNQGAARWLSERVGVPVKLPSPTRAGIKLLGARHNILGNRAVAQTHYVKDGVPIALYQLRAPRCGLGGMDEVGVHGRLYLTSQQGNYRVVAWRSGEMVMTMVSPLGRPQALELAVALRDDAEPII